MDCVNPYGRNTTNGRLLHISSRLCIQWHHSGSLKYEGRCFVVGPESDRENVNNVG